MKIKMELLSDTIFGNGMSVPGGEDISVLHDEYGFPYFKGGTFKGIFREELRLYLQIIGKEQKEIDSTVARLLGNSGDTACSREKLIFSDFCMSEYVKQKIREEVGEAEETVLDILTNLRMFTSITEDGVAKQGSLRMARCVDKGLCFYSEVVCAKEDEALVNEVLGMVKWVGSMRNRGFGKVRISVMEEA